MDEVYREGEEYQNQDFSSQPIAPGEYENCSFENCSFAGADLSGFVFVDCKFRSCDLSNTKTNSTALRNIGFDGCKMIGMRFDNCNDFLFEVHFQKCQLDLSSFYGRKLNETEFKSCSLKEVDFTEASLVKAKLIDCDLSGAVFEFTNLEGADLENSANYSIDPEKNNIRRSRHSLHGLPGLVAQHDIVITNY